MVRMISLNGVSPRYDTEGDDALGVYMILGVLGDVVVHGLELVKDVLDGLHEHGFECAGERVGVVGVVFLESAASVMGDFLRGRLLAGLSLGHELGDGEGRLRGR